MANKELNPVQELIQNVSVPFPQARAMPKSCLLYTSPSPRDAHESRMPSSA